MQITEITLFSGIFLALFSGTGLLFLGILGSIISICFLIRKTILREIEANEKLRHYCKETLKPKGTAISICDDEPVYFIYYFL